MPRSDRVIGKHSSIENLMVSLLAVITIMQSDIVSLMHQNILMCGVSQQGLLIKNNIHSY